MIHPTDREFSMLSLSKIKKSLKEACTCYPSKETLTTASLETEYDEIFEKLRDFLIKLMNGDYNHFYTTQKERQYLSDQVNELLDEIHEQKTSSKQPQIPLTTLTHTLNTTYKALTEPTPIHYAHLKTETHRYLNGYSKNKKIASTLSIIVGIVGLIASCVMFAFNPALSLVMACASIVPFQTGYFLMQTKTPLAERLENIENTLKPIASPR